MKKVKKLLVLVLAAAMVITSLAACSSGSTTTTAAASGDSTTAAAAADGDSTTKAASSGTAEKTFKIGYVAPFTGTNNDTTVATYFGNDLYLDAINEMGGIEIAGEMYNLEIIYKDTQSDANVATEVAEQLIVNDKVDLLVGAWTPFTTCPVAAVAERYEQPCICVNGPDSAWKGGLEEGTDYEWCVGLMFNIVEFLTCTMDLWDKIDTANNKVGLMYDNSANGIASAEAIPALAEERGYTIVDPGRYPSDTKDFSTMIDMFIKEEVEIVAASMDTATYATFIKQCLQKNYIPQVATGGMACHRLSTVQAVEDIAGEGSGEYVCCEVFWCPAFDTEDSFLDMGVEELEEAWEAYDSSMPLPEEICYTLATMNLIVDVLEKTPSLDKEDLRDTLYEGEIDSLLGEQTCEEGNNVYYNACTVCQWVPNSDPDSQWKYEQTIVSAKNIPQVEEAEFIPYGTGKTDK